MYIKKVRKRNGKTNKTYEYLHLVENIRTHQGPRQRLILNLGNLDVDPSQYICLAQRIQDILTGQKTLFSVDSKIERCAQHATKQIFRKQAQEISETAQTDYRNVDINSLEAEYSRSLGPEYLCHSIWNELKLNTFFEHKGVSKHIIPLLEVVVIGRLIDAGSERYTKEWAEKRSAVFELVGKPLRASLNSYYRAGDKLFSLKDDIEKYLSTTEKRVFSLREKIFFFDLTNTYFEGESNKNEKAQRGHSKEKRDDCKLVTLALVIDECGFAKYSKLFAGNQYEADTLAKIIEELGEKLDISIKERVVVIDAGIATEENIQWLKRNDYHYIAVKRGKKTSTEENSEIEVIKEDNHKGIKIEVSRYKREKEAYIFCRSEQKRAKEMGMRTRVEKLFLEKMRYYREGLSLPKRIKKYKKVIELIGRLREKYPLASKLYQVEVIPEKKRVATDKNILATDIIWKKKDKVYKDEVREEGSYVLRTNRIDLSDKEIWQIYAMLTSIEDAFKSLKSSLGLRPNFHQIENRVDTHMFISVLAYHILHIIEYRLRQRGDHRKWETIRNVLETHRRLTIGYKTKDAEGNIQQEYIRVNSKLEPEHLEIYRRFNLSGAPLPRRKFKYNP